MALWVLDTFFGGTSLNRSGTGVTVPGVSDINHWENALGRGPGRKSDKLGFAKTSPPQRRIPA